MIYLLSEWLKNFWFPFNVLHYITTRSFLAFLLAFIVGVLLIPIFVRKFRTIYESLGGYRRDFLEHHEDKRFTPSMGGLVIVLILILFSFVFLRLDTPYPYLVALTLFLFGLIGFIDDVLKILRNAKGKFSNFPSFLKDFLRQGGLSAKQKLILQFIFAAIVAFLMVKFLPIDTNLYPPFFKNLAIPLGEPLYVIFATLFIVFFSNAVNITDGLDGLAIGVSLSVFGIMAFVSYLVGNYLFATYLGIPYVPYAGELTILSMAFLGAGLAFLWFNTHPARVFMGDVGSLAIGALIAFIALATKSEFIVFLAGGVFVFEIVSVILQVFVCKLTKRGEIVYTDGGEQRSIADCKRLFKKAPFHHHLEALGWKEEQIVVRMWIVSILLGVFSLIFLKLR